MSEEIMYWSDLAELTHKTQVMKFGFCLCEDGEKSYSDCPDKGVRVLREVQFCKECEGEGCSICIVFCGDCLTPMGNCGCLA
jgi:hypothetical protein